MIEKVILGVAAGAIVVITATHMTSGDTQVTPKVYLQVSPSKTPTTTAPSPLSTSIVSTPSPTVKMTTTRRVVTTSVVRTTTKSVPASTPPVRTSSGTLRSFCVWAPSTGKFSVVIRAIARSIRPTAWPVLRDGKRVGSVYSPRPGYWQETVPAGWHTYLVTTPAGTRVASLRLAGGACVPR